MRSIFSYNLSYSLKTEAEILEFAKAMGIFAIGKEESVTLKSSCIMTIHFINLAIVSPTSVCSIFMNACHACFLRTLIFIVPPLPLEYSNRP